MLLVTKDYYKALNMNDWTMKCSHWPTATNKWLLLMDGILLIFCCDSADYGFWGDLVSDNATFFNGFLYNSYIAQEAV